MNTEQPKQLPGETDSLYQKRLKAIQTLGQKWILAKKQEKLPEDQKRW